MHTTVALDMVKRPVSMFSELINCYRFVDLIRTVKRQDGLSNVEERSDEMPCLRVDRSAGCARLDGAETEVSRLVVTLVTVTAMS